MGKRIVATDSAHKSIRDVSAAAGRIQHATVAEALGAEDVKSKFRGQDIAMDAFQLRVELLRRLHSSGGRPALDNAMRRIKIPVTEKQCRDLEDLVESLADLDFAPSAGQVASVLLDLSLRLAKESPQSVRRELIARDPIAKPGKQVSLGSKS
jgi:hypothetical protein